jgi:hypothetical protein
MQLRRRVGILAGICVVGCWYYLSKTRQHPTDIDPNNLVLYEQNNAPLFPLIRARCDVAVTSGASVANDTDVMGVALGWAIATTAGQCCARCSAAPKCILWTFVVETQVCGS